jgi:Na+-translocating ferredoxin:NAD+ oxidoreductase subunit B
MWRLLATGRLPVAAGPGGKKARAVTIMGESEKRTDRRGFVADGLRVLGAIGIGGAATALAIRKGAGGGDRLADRLDRQGYVWQIDPDKCMACGRCQTNCVLDISAAKCVNAFALCGYCDVCTGYFRNDYSVLDTGAEEQLCPTGAIVRRFIEKKPGVRFFEYTIDESLCIACGKCVIGCRQMNGSLYLQVRHDRCLNCNECSIAVGCPTQAFRRVPSGSPNLLSKAARDAEEALARRRPAGDGRAAGGANA